MEETIRTALEYYRTGNDEAAIASLLELADELLPTLADIYRNETDPDLRAFLVRIGWERREAGAVEFILEALNDPAEEVWQSALDGTVALASPEILERLRAAVVQERADAAMTRRFQICVQEAILYVEDLVRRA